MQYNRLLDGRCAVIVGGSTSIGREVAMLFASHGSKVVLIDEPGPQLDVTLAALRQIEPDAVAFAGDLTSAVTVQRLCEQAASCLPKVDILVNSAGIAIQGAAHTLSEEDFMQVLNTHLLCAIASAKAIVPHMCDCRRGDIINFTPDLASFSVPGTAAIAAAAGGLLAFTRSVTMDYIRYHVRANCICYPLDGMSGRQPLLGSPDSIDAANAALWFASEMSTFIIGEALPVNGGIAYVSSSKSTMAGVK